MSDFDLDKRPEQLPGRVDPVNDLASGTSLGLWLGVVQSLLRWAIGVLLLIALIPVVVLLVYVSIRLALRGADWAGTI